MKITVGCPIKDRYWILPTWFNYVEDAAKIANVDVNYIFVVSKNDVRTLEILESKENTTLIFTDEVDETYRRIWNKSRYEHMVHLRNKLLRQVRKIKPFYFLSLDSDILIHPQAIKNMFDAFEQYPDAWAVGSKCFLSTTTRVHPNMGNWSDRNFNKYYRADSNNLVHSDILMAIKMMSPKAYNIDYQPHIHGEDLGWSRAVKEAGGEMFWDGKDASKHVMNMKMLDLVDKRVGY
jgi:hypothetical protein